MVLEGTAVVGAIQTTSRAVQAVRHNAGTGGKGVAAVLGTGYSSLTDVASVARVEPICMVDSDVANYEHADVIMQTIHSMFTGYYLQAVNMAGSIQGVSIAERLAPLNPHARTGLEAFDDVRLSETSLRHRLPLSTDRQVAFEDDRGDRVKVEKNGMLVDKDAYGKLAESINLSVGRMVNVTIKEDSFEFSVPISIRLLVNVLPIMQMVDLFTFRDSFDMDLKERWHAWRSGRLSFLEMALCIDLVDKYRRAALRDKTGLTEAILNREAGHILQSTTSHRVSLATATNLAVMSKETLDQIELKLSGKFTNSQIRKSVFDNTNLMILAVVDRGYDMVTFYHRGMDLPSTVSIKQMKAANAKGGMDVSDIMKAYMLGNAPLGH